MTTRRPRIPGPKGRLLLGSVAEFQADKLGFLKRCAAEFGDVFAFRAGPTRVVVVNDLAGIETMLVAEPGRFHKSRMTRDIFGRIMGRGLVVSEGDFHRRQRRAVQASIDAARIQAHAALVKKHARRVIDRWPAAGSIDVEAEMSAISLGVVSELLFGADLGEEGSRLLQAMRDFQEIGAALVNSGFLPPRWLPTPMNRKLSRAVTEIDAVVDLLIKRCQQESEARDDLLSRLLSSRDEEGRTMPVSNVRDEIRTLFSAGYETSANAMTWTSYFMARDATLQERLTQKEESSYAFWFAKETLRARCPIWAFNRSPVERISVSGHEILPSDLVIISPYLLHSDPRHFKDPLRFDPERFSPDREHEHPKLAFMPFGAGPRACVGARLALTEVAVVAQAIAERFRLELDSDREVQEEAFLTVRPRGGLTLKVAALAAPRE